MTDNGSDAGSQAGRDEDEEDEETVPRIITDDFFAELLVKTGATIKNLQGDQQYTLAEELQRVLAVGQNLKLALAEQQDANQAMQDEVANAVGKVAAAFEISQSDQDTIARLKEEIENAWRQTDAAQTREQSAQEQLQELQVRLDKLQVDIKKAAKRDSADELGQNLAKHKEGILRERDRLNAEVEELNKRLQIQRIYTDEIEHKRGESEKKNKELYKLLDETSSEAYQKIRMVDHLKQEIIDLNAQMGGLHVETKQLKSQLEQMHANNGQLNGKLLATKAALEKMTAMQQVTAGKLAHCGADLEAATLAKRTCHMELQQCTTQLKLRDSECNRLVKDNQQLIKYREQLQKKLMHMERNKGDLVQDILKMKNDIVTFEKERDANKKAFDKIRQFSDDLQRERDLVRKDLQRAERTIADQAELMRIHEQKIKQLGVEITHHLEAAQKQRSMIAKLEKERDKHLEEAQVLSDKLEQCQDDLLAKVNHIALLNENIAELKTKMAHIQQSFEVARSERNAFQRDLQATVEDRDDLRERIRIAIGQIEQLKEDLAVKEGELVRANKTIDHLEKDKIALKLEIQNTNIILQLTRTELKEKKLENERLYKTLSEDEMRLVKLRQQLDNTTNEKDLIGTQMIRRNDEIGLLNEKILIITMALDRGEAQYNKRLDDIRLLKIEIGNLRSQRNLLTRGLANTADMRQEVLQLNRVLTQERVRAKALEQEMMTPMNIHRWRKLSGKDPDKMEMIVKVAALQKRILKQTVEATDRESAMQEAHNLYMSLKQFMLKLPDQTVREKLNETKRVLSVRTRKMKALAAEVRCNQLDEKALELNVQNYQATILELRQQLVKQKRDNQRLREKMTSADHEDDEAHNNVLMPLSTQNAYKTVGSGYRIPTTAHSDHS